MTIRSNRAVKLAHTVVRQPAAWLSAVRSLLTTAQHTLTLCGLSAIAVAILLYTRPDLARQASIFLLQGETASTSAVQAPALSALMAQPAAPVPTNPTHVTEQDKALLGNAKQQQFVTSWLAKRYRVAGDAVDMLVSTAYLTANEIKLDPLLILAVMAIESGLNPFAESPVGAQGLMQVMSKVHRERFEEMGGIRAALNPVANIRVGALILKDYVTRGGSVEAGLKTYVGAAGFDNDNGYGALVLGELKLLRQVATGKKVPFRTPMAVAPVKPEVVPNLEKSEQIAGL